MKLTTILKEIQVGSRIDIVNSMLNSNKEDVKDQLVNYLEGDEGEEYMKFIIKEMEGAKYSVAVTDNEYEFGFAFSDNREDIAKLHDEGDDNMKINGKTIWFTTYMP